MKYKKWRQIIMAENNGVMFHRVMLRIEGNLDTGEHR